MHPAVKVDAASLTADIPDELQNAFDQFLNECTEDASFGRVMPLSMFKAAFHAYVRHNDLGEPASGTQVNRLMDVAGYIPDWHTSKSGTEFLAVRGLNLKDRT